MRRGLPSPDVSAFGRPLTPGEWRALSAGLAGALRAAGARPLIRSSAHPAARVAAVWRGTPILTRGDAVWWPGAPADFSTHGLERGMATLQHELQHVLDYRIGRLTAARYLGHPRHWTYRWRLDAETSWDELGAEQRASMAEYLWLAERGLAAGCDLDAVRRLIPWA